MAVNLSVKNVPDALADQLRQRAERNRRSLQRELLSILERAAQERASDAVDPARPMPTPTISIEQLAARARKLFPKGTPGSVDFIREQRDLRLIAGPARGGRRSSSQR